MHNIINTNRNNLFLIYIELGYYDLADRSLAQAEEIAKYNKYDKVEKQTIAEMKKLLNPNNIENVKLYLQDLLDKHSDKLINIDKDIFNIYLKK